MTARFKVRGTVVESERIAVAIENGVAQVELVRDSKLNAMDGNFFAELGDSFRRLSHDRDVRAILLSARGKHFTAGLDLAYAGSQFGRAADPGRAAEARLRHVGWLQDAFTALADCRVPVVAAVHGGCIGAGVDLVSACDLRVCSADAFFQVAEIDVAIAADLGTLQRLTYLIPEGVVRDLTFTGRRMEAEEAARLSLVNRVLPDRESAVAAGLDLARTIAAKSPLAVAGAKLALNYSRGRPVEEGLRHVAMWNAGALVSADLTAAVKARLGRQVPSFGNLDD
jgi:enoyl-CoA hydratase/carnithine racemase